MTAIKVDKSHIETYNEQELQLNVLQQEITTARLRTIKPATMIVLVFATHIYFFFC